MPASIASRQGLNSRGQAAPAAKDRIAKTAMLSACRAARNVSGSARPATMPATMKPVAQMTTKRPGRMRVSKPCVSGAVAVLVFLPAAARTRIVAADLRAFALHRLGPRLVEPVVAHVE